MFFQQPPITGPGKSKVSLKREWYIKGDKPETIESLFIAYRLTGDYKYRSAGWKIFRAIEKNCKIPNSKGGGYASIRNVDRVEGERGWVDKMETFFIAETLKYLFLLFSDKSVVPLNNYVFNTEAHPLPIFTPSQELLDLIEFPP
ncbi:mannosyl-oligosaccharide alpha-1,2-mannosidase [Tulasnella sp. JGI-2019a]|nr:mannosyl-oligosaccharide alpha-1,2-mannosidase [Tulasnella sp. JGI-2019a]